jgi:hypothetical protein
MDRQLLYLTKGLGFGILGGLPDVGFVGLSGAFSSTVILAYTV